MNQPAELLIPELSPRPVVHKFGGSSLSDAGAIHRCVDILEHENAQRVFVVVSAARGVTDALFELADGNLPDEPGKPLAALHVRTANIAVELLPPDYAERFLEQLRADIAGLQKMLGQRTAAGGGSGLQNEVVVHGELWAMRLLSAALAARGMSAAALDARAFMRVKAASGTPAVDWTTSANCLAKALATLHTRFLVVPGFVARSHAGTTVTLGRNSSDWSATIVARLTNSSSVTIWTDVAGLMEADPRVVPEARAWPSLGRGFAARLAEAGARVLHPATLDPVKDCDIQVCVKSSLDARRAGTLIVAEERSEATVIASRPLDSQRSEVTVVGRNFLPGALLSLSQAGVDFDEVRGGREVLHVEVARSNAERVQRIWHRSLCRNRRQLDAVLLGTGNVGSEFLRKLQTPGAPAVRLLGAANSRVMLFDRNGLVVTDVVRELGHGDRATRIPELVENLINNCEAPPVVIDATASETVAAEHSRWLAAGVHVVTANKAALANGWVDAAGDERTFYGDAATVGAGLPVLAAIRRLRAAGDTIISVDGLLSGSLSFLFHGLQQERSFSATLHEAMRAGLTEPDPRHDLAGADVIRKLKIIARAAGLGDIAPHAETLLASGDDKLSLDAFLSSLAENDAEWQRRVRAAHGKGRVLRYVAGIAADGSAHVGISEVSCDAALAQTTGTDNCVSVHSHAYANEPLVIHGPGAGAAVTARALLADIATLIQRQSHY